jgi:Peptidase S46
MKKQSVFAFLLLIFAKTYASEGMWLPHLLSQLNEAEMKSLGMKMSAEDIYSVNKGSLKDAIVSFGGFCTGEIISEKGLILTNHHCGYDAIAEQSSLERNYLEQGFWAKKTTEELPIPGLFVTFIIRIEDATSAALSGVTEDMDEKTRQSKIDQNLAVYKKTIIRESNQDLLIRPFFDGNQYFMFVTETFRDIRLVGAPPSSIGKFGSDTDNWVYPRHTGDFSMFRIYADDNNRASDFSTSNVPFKPKHALPISLDGVAEGDFTMIFGFPGRTQAYLPSQAVDLTQNALNPTKVAIRDMALKIMDADMRADPATKLLYASRYASVSNGWKKWLGEMGGLRASNAVAKRQNYEKEFLAAQETNGEWKKQFGSILPNFSALYADFGKYSEARDRFRETNGNCALLSLASEMSGLSKVFDPKDGKKLEDMRKNLKASAANFFKENRMATDEKIFAALTRLFFEKNPKEWSSTSALAMVKKGDFAAFAKKIYQKSILSDEKRLANALDLPAEKLIKLLEKDPAMQFSNAMQAAYDAHISPKIAEMQPKITRLQRQFMKAQMTVFEGQKRFYPDANSTLRVGYGQVRGMQPKDGLLYTPYTYLDGVMEKYVPGDYEFDVPKRLIELYATKDFGQYAAQNGKIPVCFIGQNHTTGGNSGSPAIDAHGNLVGLNFDRVWEGTMSDINYDAAICRNVMVDARYVLFIVDKFAGATNLIEEMKLVHPKK